MFTNKHELASKILTLVKNRNIITKLNFSNNSKNTTDLLSDGYRKKWLRDGLINEFHALITNSMDVFLRKVKHYTIVSDWTSRVADTPSLQGKNLLWLQLLQVDEQESAQLKLYTLGLQEDTTSNDLDVELSRKLFKDAAPFFMKDVGLWIFSRSLVRKGFKGSIDAAALKFSPFASLNYHQDLSIDPSAGIRCADIFLFFAVKGDIPGDDLCNREAIMKFLNALNSEDGARKIHAFSVTSGSVIATSEKLQELRGKHLTA